MIEDDYEYGQILEDGRLTELDVKVYSCENRFKPIPDNPSYMNPFTPQDVLECMNENPIYAKELYEKAMRIKN